MRSFFCHPFPLTSFCLRGLSTRGFLRGAPIVWAVMERVAILGASGALASEPKAGAAHSGERWIATLMRVRV